MVTEDLLGMHNYSYVWIDPEGDCRPIEELGAMCTGLNVASAWPRWSPQGLWPLP